MVVKEVVKLENGTEEGRIVTINLTEDEHTFLLSYAINHMIARGMLKIGNDAGEVVGDVIESTADLIEKVTK